MQVLARDYLSEKPISISIENGAITGREFVETGEPLPWVAPGLFDLQINGYGGVWFSDEELTVEQVLEVLHAHYQYGITHLCPTLITNSFAALEHGFHTIRQACDKESWANAMVLGCHLEGPYISAEDGPRGAHPLDHVRGCDWEEFKKLQAASGNRIRLVTLAPEADNAVSFTETAVSNNVCIAIGHTAANTEQIDAVVTAGATLSTHLGNGAHGTIRRHPNYIWDQLGDRRLTASIIADGFHLPPNVVRSFYYAKGLEKLVLTCDASGLAGCPPGEYDYHGGRFEVLETGSVVIAGQRQFLAGSGVQTDVCIHTMMEMTGVSLGEAWTMATKNPGELLNVPYAELKTGAPADLVVFEHDASGLKIERTMARGEWVYTAR